MGALDPHPLDESLAKRALWLVVAFIVGVAVGFKAQTLTPRAPVAPVPLIGPAPAATPSPATATAAAAVKTRVIIERPITPAGASVALAGAPATQAGTPVTDAEPKPSPAIERIVIETEGMGNGAATIPAQPPPAPAAAVNAGPSLPIGLTVGTFPGMLALDWQLVAVDVGDLIPLPGLSGLRLGASTIVNGQGIGVGGNLSLTSLHPHLYLSAGIQQPFKLIPEPVPFVGLGWRL